MMPSLQSIVSLSDTLMPSCISLLKPSNKSYCEWRDFFETHWNAQKIPTILFLQSHTLHGTDPVFPSFHQKKPIYGDET